MEKIIITIGRQYGSGGHAIGEQLSRLLKLPFYDKELIEMASEQSGIEAGVLWVHDERVRASLFKMKSGGGMRDGVPLSDTLYRTQCRIIQELAKKESCIFIGRTANHCLRECPHLLSVFVTAPLPQRIERIMERNRMSRKDAEAAIKKVDAQRADYYNHYTKSQWGEASGYQLVVDSSQRGVEKTAEYLAGLASERMNEIAAV